MEGGTFEEIFLNTGSTLEGGTSQKAYDSYIKSGCFETVKQKTPKANVKSLNRIKV